MRAARRSAARASSALGAVPGAAFVALVLTLVACASARELLARGWEDDVATSAALDVSTVVCRLVADEFRAD